MLFVFYLVGFLVIFPWGGRDCVGGVDADGDRVEVWAFTGLRQRDLNDPKLRREVPLVLLYLPFVGAARLFGYQHVLLGGREHATGC
ncbi:MAG: hypothetical protein IT452_11215 [Planctomycetia bacterium]|nr:hypothetical protein [Planctomycetia bacterium]